MEVHGTPLGFLIMTEIVPQININNIVLPLQGRCCNVIVLSRHPVSTDHLLFVLLLSFQFHFKDRAH